MSEKTGIEWATSTGNPWIGCTKVSPGCAHCYAAEMDAQHFSKTMGGTEEQPQSHWGKGAPRVRTKAFWKDALKWSEEAGRFKRSDGFVAPRIFPSLCDWLDDEVPIEWLADFLKLIHDTPNLDWLLLTKRPENFFNRIKHVWDYQRDHTIGLQGDFWVGPPRNVWVGVSVEDQPRADLRIPQLLQIPAKVHFLSVEPLLECVDLKSTCRSFLSPEDKDDFHYANNGSIDWVIIGGESGPNRRDCGVDAICDVARRCVAAGVPCFVKQDCALRPGQQGRIPEDIWALKQFPKV